MKKTHLQLRELDLQREHREKAGACRRQEQGLY
jgi:hypothetical protein